MPAFVLNVHSFDQAQLPFEQAVDLFWSPAVATSPPFLVPIGIQCETRAG